MIKVMIADDQMLIRDSLKIVLNNTSTIEVVLTASDGLDVLRLLKVQKVDIILMDIRMPRLDGVECTRRVKELYPDVKIIILTTFDDDEYVFNALKYGASGYLLKAGDMVELQKAIEIVYSGQAMINPDIASKVVRLFSNLAKSKSTITVAKENQALLTGGEWKIIHEIERGSSNKEIAEDLHLSEGTVRNYITVILDKLALRDRTQLAIWAVQIDMRVE